MQQWRVKECNCSTGLQEDCRRLPRVDPADLGLAPPSTPLSALPHSPLLLHSVLTTTAGEFFFFLIFDRFPSQSNVCTLLVFRALIFAQSGLQCNNLQFHIWLETGTECCTGVRYNSKITFKNVGQVIVVNCGKDSTGEKHISAIFPQFAPVTIPPILLTGGRVADATAVPRLR